MNHSNESCHAHSSPTDHGGHSGHAGHSGHRATWKGAASATVHCLTGCAIGEFAGLAIGVSLGWSAMSTMALAVVLAFISGYTLTLIPFLRQGVPLVTALKSIWLVEFVSIAVMEIAMNTADYQMGGMSVSSMADPKFWTGYGAALVAGFLAAWPVNYWLLGRGLKNCH